MSSSRGSRLRFHAGRNCGPDKPAPDMVVRGHSEGAAAREGCAARPFVRTVLHDGVAHAIALCVSSLHRIPPRVIASAALSPSLPVTCRDVGLLTKRPL